MKTILLKTLTNSVYKINPNKKNNEISKTNLLLPR